MRLCSGSSVLRLGTMVAVLIVLAGCTKGGQFDPTEMLNNDMFESKKALKGQREPVFPNGVPGISTGIPPDLVKGYQPPPEPPAEDVAPAQTAAAVPGPPQHGPNLPARPLPGPNVKPKVKVAHVPPKRRVPIRVGLGPKSTAPAPKAADRAVWPAPPTTSIQQGGPPGQSVWPAGPPTAPVQQQAGQQPQSVWPAPPAPSTYPSN